MISGRHEVDVGGEGSTFNNALDFIECSTTAELQMFMKLRVDHLTGKKLARRFRYSQSGIAKRSHCHPQCCQK